MTFIDIVLIIFVSLNYLSGDRSLERPESPLFSSYNTEM